MPIRHSPAAKKHRTSAWSSSAETPAPVTAESSTRLKQASPDDDELEQDIQASLTAALDDLDKLELFAPDPERFRAFKPKMPRGMPPLPHGRLIPPLPVARLSLVPRLFESWRPKPSVAECPEPVAVLQTAQAPDTTVAVGRRRWPGVALALLALALLAAGWWWLQLR